MSRTQIVAVAATGIRITRSRPIWIGSPSSRPSERHAQLAEEPTGRRQDHEELRADRRGAPWCRATTPRKAPRSRTEDRRRQHHQEQRHARGVQLAVGLDARAARCASAGVRKAHERQHRDQVNEVLADKRFTAIRFGTPATGVCENIRSSISPRLRRRSVRHAAAAIAATRSHSSTIKRVKRCVCMDTYRLGSCCNNAIKIYLTICDKDALPDDARHGVALSLPSAVEL